MTTPSLPPDIDFQANREASPARMNQAMLWIYGQIQALQTARVSAEDQLAVLQTVGLARIQQALTPVYEKLVSIANLGVLFNATSETPAQIQTGTAVLVVDADVRAQFAFCGFMVAVSQSDAGSGLMGRVEGYDRTSGELTIDVFIASGVLGTLVSDWSIMPCVPPFLPATAIDAGSDTTVDSVAVPYVLSQEVSGGDSITELDPGLDTGGVPTSSPPSYIPGAGSTTEVDPGLA